MKLIQTTSHKEIFRLLLGLAKSLRGFQDEATFCEDVTYAQFAILDYVVDNNGTMPLSSLHGLLSVEKSTTTRLVAPLLKRELLTKERSEDDGRAFDLVLTDEGQRIHGVVWECLTGLLGRLTECMPEEEVQVIMNSLTSVAHALETCCKD